MPRGGTAGVYVRKNPAVARAYASRRIRTRRFVPSRRRHAPHVDAGCFRAGDGLHSLLSDRKILGKPGTACEIFMRLGKPGAEVRKFHHVHSESAFVLDPSGVSPEGLAV